MAITVANTEITNNFEFWRTRTNELAYAMSSNVVTTGATTPGSAGVTQNFIANQHISGTGTTNATMNTSSVFITNSTSSITLTMPTVNQVANGTYYLASDSVWKYNATANTYGAYNVQTAILIDSFKKSQYSVADYIVHVSDRAAGGNAVHCSRMFVTHANSSTEAFITEYSTITTNAAAGDLGKLGTFSASANNTDIKLYFTSIIDNTGIKIIRTIV